MRSAARRTGSVGRFFSAWPLALSALLLPALASCAGPPMHKPLKYHSYPNPTLVPINDPEYVWEKMVDVVNDYFPIEREERVRLVNDTATEGYLETKPVMGATLLEPWRKDSADHYERLESTFQTIRRRALVRVAPDERGYLVEFAVFKELEDLPRPEHASSGDAVFRSDQSLQKYRETVADQVAPVGWIPQGRDHVLEQAMIADFQASLGREE